MWVQTQAGQLVNLDHAEEIVTRLTEDNLAVELVAVLPDDSAWELSGFHVNTLKMEEGLSAVDELHHRIAPYRAALLDALTQEKGFCDLGNLAGDHG